MNAEEVANHLGARRSGGGWSALCPAHADTHPSLTIHEGRDGALLLKCHSPAACSFEAIMACLPEGGGSSVKVKAPESHVLATYTYTDEAGSVLYAVERRTPKGFTQKTPNGKGGWTPRLGDVRRVPYHLPELLAGIAANRLVFIPEGEKDVETLERHGFLATTSSGGAPWPWPAEWAKYFAGARVCILPDNDGPGKKSAAQRARILSSAAAVRVVEMPGLPDKGDVTDWIETQGHTAEELKALFKAAPMWGEENAIAEPAGVRLQRGKGVRRTQVTWLWPDRIAKGKLTLLAGHPGAGKSYLALAIAACVTAGGVLPDGASVEAGRVVMVAYEDDAEDTIMPRFDLLGGDDNLIDLVSYYVDDEGERQVFSARHVHSLVEAIRLLPDTKLVIIDPVMSFVGGKIDTNRDNEVRAALTPLVRLADECGISVLAVCHFNKGEAATVLHRIGGSVAFTALARGVLLAAKEPGTGRRALIPLKNNIGRDDAVPIEYVIDHMGLSWLGMAPDLGVERMTAERRDNEEQVSASTWIAEYLSRVGTANVKDIEEEARGEGVSWPAVQKAKQRLGDKVATHRINEGGRRGSGYSVWEWNDRSE